MSDPGPILTETITALQRLPMGKFPEAIFMPADRWDLAFKEMAAWCGEKYGLPMPFVRRGYDLPHFLLMNIPCVGIKTHA